MWLLSQGSKVEVIGPEELKTEWLKEAVDILKREGSETMITNYKKAKEDVLKAYSSFLPIIETVKDGKETSYDASLSSLAKQAENIRQDKFLLMIVGEAKSGKSTFINAYLGEEILPMDVKQCTSSIVEIRYGEKFILRATYADDRVLIFEDEQQIKDFLTANAALDDNYRDIPVSTINIEILMP